MVFQTTMTHALFGCKWVTQASSLPRMEKPSPESVNYHKLLVIDASRPALAPFSIGLAHSRVRLQWLCQGPWLAGPGPISNGDLRVSVVVAAEPEAGFPKLSLARNELMLHILRPLTSRCFSVAGDLFVILDPQSEKLDVLDPFIKMSCLGVSLPESRIMAWRAADIDFSTCVFFTTPC